MLIVNLEAIAAFSKLHADSRGPLQRWVRITQDAKWNSLAEIRKSFNSADYKSNQYIFNIKGDDYRLRSSIIFTAQTVMVIDVLTHAEYSKLRL